MEPVVACADVGSVRAGRFGWYDSLGAYGELPSTLAARVAALLDAGSRVALGFECPLFVPLPDEELQLGCARPGEGSRPWSAGAGSGALATGLVQVVWVLAQIRASLHEPAPAHTDWASFASSTVGLYLWEAFVSGGAKGSGHIDDARLAVSAFQRALPDLAVANAVSCFCPVYSLIGAALLRTGWSTDPAVLNSACVVIKA
jgi:hypothetical protein